MNVEEALREVYEDSNEQDDLSPYVDGLFSVTAPGAVRLLQWFARGAKVVSTWKFRNNQRVRFPILEAEDVVSSQVLTGVAINTIWSTTKINLAAAHDGTENAYRGWLFTIDDVAYTVLNSTALELTLNAVVVEPADATYTLAQRDYAYGAGLNDWALTHKPVEFISLFDLTDGVSLEKAEFHERFPTNYLSAGTPAMWTRTGTGIRLDLFPDVAHAYNLRYVRYAEVGTAANDDICELPDAFHDPLCAWVKHGLLVRDGDFTAAQSAWLAFETLMYGLRLQADMSEDYGNEQGRIDRS
jgi:hypothetical protein